MDSSGAQFDKEQNIQSLQPQSLHGEEITRQDLILVVGHQLAPTQRAVAHRCWDNLMPVEYIANGRAGDLETQLEEFALQFAISPAGIFFCQTHNQVFKLGIEPGSTALAPTRIGPLAPHQFTMPPEHRFGLKNPEDLLELLGRSVRMAFEFVDQNSQDHFFCPGGLDRFLLFAGHDVELVAENQDFKVLV